MTPRGDKPARLEGLDLARYLALAGMVLVNFRLALQPRQAGPQWLEWLFHFFEGKASATFVVLAGLSLALATRSLEPQVMRAWTLRRALFLLVVGLFNLWIFPADIIHYYAIYFLLALPWLRVAKGALCIIIGAVALASLWAQLHLDYSQQWNWSTLQYQGLWTPAGMTRNLLFNGFHPVLPWLAFFLYGILLTRLPLQQPRIQRALIADGLGGAALACLLSWLGDGSGWAWLLNTTPIPPGPVYLLMGISAASVAIGASLRVAEGWPQGVWRHVLPAGRMTLTIYLAHILIGMGLLEELGALDGSWSLAEAALAAALFVLPATAAAWCWNLKWPQGPVEMLMRRLTALRTPPRPDRSLS